MGGRLGAVVGALVAVALVAVLGLLHADEVARAFAAVPAWAAAGAVGLHVLTLVLRSEAWRVTLASAGGVGVPRTAVHAANATAFVAGALQSQAALPARVALLRRLAGSRAPSAAQICVSDVPIFALELCATALLLAAGVFAGRGAWWIAPAAIALAAAVLGGARMAPARLQRRPMVRGLAVLADRRRLPALVCLVAALVALTVARIWLLLAVCGLPHTLADVAWVFAALGVFGLLPVGPGAAPGATLATLGTASAGASVAAGLMLSASGIVAVVVYALLVALSSRLLAAGAGRWRSALRLARGLGRATAPSST